PAQDALRAAYDNDGVYGFKVIFPSGNGFLMRAEVRQHTWDSQTNGVVAATFSLRLKGKPTNINAPGVLSFATDLPASQTVAAGSALTMGVVVQGGTAPYTYAWKKGTSTVSGQTSATFTKASAVSGDAGVYSCVVTDADGTVITSSDCTVTIN
ncbi:immunoglobulin domain-containing protein, partial [Klebsiella variicola]